MVKNQIAFKATPVSETKNTCKTKPFYIKTYFVYIFRLFYIMIFLCLITSYSDNFLMAKVNRKILFTTHGRLK